MTSHRDLWRISSGDRPDLAAIDTRSTAGAPGTKNRTRADQAGLVAQLAEMQNRLWAEHRRSLLLVLQAMDAGGKDGTIRKVFTGVNPQGVRVASFKQPSEEELAHDFLWRIHRSVPAHGEIGVFNRSHYEDVLIVRVDELVPKEVWRRRYGQIREFEELLVGSGTTIVKVFLHISKDEQRERFQSRLDEPSKRWKFSSADLTVRAKWDDYRAAYEDAIAETSTVDAPWYVVPADRKWYRDWAVLQILLETLRQMDPEYPEEEAGLDQLVIT
jgi:PPK2 family polyphosphate:nucleotide phosphotransferase